MDRIELSEDQVTTMDAIAEGVLGLRIAFVNVFGVSHADGTWTLIDAGVPGSLGRIRTWAERSFGRPANAIVLTHGHFDHVGEVAELADGWDCPIFAHSLEFPYLTGQRAYDAPNWQAGGGLMSLLSPMYPKEPIDLGTRLKALPGEGEEMQMADMPGWTLLHTPGHTPGHVSFLRKSDQTLIVGDAFCTTKPESFLRRRWRSRLSCMGRPRTLRRTGRPQRRLWRSWRDCRRLQWR